MTLQEVMQHYNVSRMTALVKLANVWKMGDRYDASDVRRIFEPDPEPMSDNDAKEALYAYIREEIRF